MYTLFPYAFSTVGYIILMKGNYMNCGPTPNPKKSNQIRMESLMRMGAHYESWVPSGCFLFVCLLAQEGDYASPSQMESPCYVNNKKEIKWKSWEDGSVGKVIAHELENLSVNPLNRLFLGTLQPHDIVASVRFRLGKRLSQKIRWRTI